MIGASGAPRGPLFHGLDATPGRGETPIVFTTGAEAKGAGGVSTMTMKVPRAAVEDIFKLAMMNH